MGTGTFMGNSCEFRENPDLEGVAKQLSEKFDQLFRTKTGYDKLDERICKTKENKGTSIKRYLFYQSSRCTTMQRS